MGRVVYNFPLRRTSDSVLTANTAPRIELFRTATYATASGTSSVTLPVADRGGISNGDTIYVGVSASSPTSPSGNLVTVTAGGGNVGAGNLTLNTAISWNNRDAVVVKRKTGASSDAYATIYSDPTWATSIAQPFTSDSDNEWEFQISPGRYGLRVSNSAGQTLQLDHDIAFDELDWVQVTPGHDSATAGIAEALLKLSASAGKVYIPAGAYNVSVNIPQATPNVLIEGAGNATLINITADIDGFSFTGAGGLQNLRIRPTVANSNNLVKVDSPAYFRLKGVRVDPNGLTNTGKGIYLLNVLRLAPVEVDIFGTTGTFATDLQVEGCAGVQLAGSSFGACTDAVKLINCAGFSAEGNNFRVGITNAWNIDAASTDIFISSANYYTGVTNRYSLAASTAAKRAVLAGVNALGEVQFDGLPTRSATTQNITAVGNTLNPQGRSVLKLTADASYTLTSAPTLGDGIQDQELLILNIDTVDVITIQDQGTLANSNLRLSATTIALGPRDSILLRYDTTIADWVQIGQTNVL